MQVFTKTKVIQRNTDFCCNTQYISQSPFHSNDLPYELHGLHLGKSKFNHIVHKAHHCIIFWASSIQSTPPYSVTSILSPYIRLFIPSSLVPPGIWMHSYGLLCPPPPRLNLLYSLSVKIFGEKYKLCSCYVCPCHHGMARYRDKEGGWVQ